MNKEDILAFSQIPQPPHDSLAFVDDLKRPLSYHFTKGSGCPAGVAQDCMKNGVELDIISSSLYEAYHDLSEIVGKAYDDDLIDHLFKNFCLGK